MPLAYFNGPDILHNMVKFELFGKPFEVLGYTGFFLGGDANDMSVLTMFLFQMVFMDTAATIPTGAMAERWKFSAFVIYGFFMSMLIYPVYGCWVWGGGWLADLGANFGLGNGHMDFAGSSVVHMTGGVTALAGAIVLGPRIGKFNKDGSANAIPGHYDPDGRAGHADPGLRLVRLQRRQHAGRSPTDGRPACASAPCSPRRPGCVTAMLYMWVVFGKPDPTMACNGMLAGLVAITAPCAFVNPIGAVIIGAIAGVLVIWSVLFVERVLKVDDPVGAVSVHGVCGAFGCLCIGLFADGKYGAGWNGVADKTPLGLFYGGGVEQLIAQSIGVAANILWVFPVAYLSFMIIEKTVGNRVSAKDEINGLDIPEMGIFGYISEDPIIVQQRGTRAPLDPRPRRSFQGRRDERCDAGREPGAGQSFLIVGDDRRSSGGPAIPSWDGRARSGTRCRTRLVVVAWYWRGSSFRKLSLQGQVSRSRTMKSPRSENDVVKEILLFIAVVATVFALS